MLIVARWLHTVITAHIIGHASRISVLLSRKRLKSKVQSLSNMTAPDRPSINPVISLKVGFFLKISSDRNRVIRGMVELMKTLAKPASQCSSPLKNKNI